MKKELSLLLVLAMIFTVGGCITDNDDDDKDSNVNDGTGGTVGSYFEQDKLAETYFPLADGMKWTYLVGNNYGNGVIKSTYTRTVNPTAMIKHSNDQWTSYNIQDNIVNAGGYILTASLHISVNALMFDFNKSYGQTWTVFTDTWDSETLKLDERMICEYIGTEDVVVPTHQYHFCRKYLFNFDQVQNGRHTAIESIVWLAPYVGMVKMTKAYYDSGEMFRTETFDLSTFETGE